MIAPAMVFSTMFELICSYISQETMTTSLIIHDVIIISRFCSGGGRT
jgi:hypothetical protein